MDKFFFFLGNLLFCFVLSSSAMAQVQQSPNYQLPESYIGPGGGMDGASPNYSDQATIGDIGISQSTSSNFRIESGFNTSSEPRLTMVVSSSSVAFGAMSTAVTRTGTASFSVLNYTSHGYSVFLIGPPPTTGAYSLSAMNGAASSVGTEQFGINLRANTSPIAIGADPVQVPSGNFSFGAAATGYNTANSYRYVNGEKIAESLQSSGQTDYVISYILNASVTTPGGQYSSSQSLVVVGTY